MTREEVIEKLKGFDLIGSNEDIEFQEALDVSIKSLEAWDNVIEQIEHHKNLINTAQEMKFDNEYYLRGYESALLEILDIIKNQHLGGE